MVYYSDSSITSTLYGSPYIEYLRYNQEGVFIALQTPKSLL